jgi:hypothetical protein
MAYIAKRKNALDRRTQRDYDRLYRKLDGLILYVSKHLKPGEQEMLFGDQIKIPEGSLPKIECSKYYVLTNEGLKSANSSKIGSGGFGDFDYTDIKPLDVIWELEKPNELFDAFCINLQNVIRKHKIRVPKKYRTV